MTTVTSIWLECGVHLSALVGMNAGRKANWIGACLPGRWRELSSATWNASSRLDSRSGLGRETGGTSAEGWPANMVSNWRPVAREGAPSGGGGCFSGGSTASPLCASPSPGDAGTWAKRFSCLPAPSLLGSLPGISWHPGDPSKCKAGRVVESREPVFLLPS